MTVVRIYFKKTNDGGTEGLARSLHFAPSSPFKIAGEPDALVLPEPFEVLADESGRADVDLLPSGPGWVWQVYSHGKGFRAGYEYVIVPDLVDPIDFTDLVRVDRKTLEPTEEPPPLWWAELEAARVLGAQVEAARVEAVQSAADALGYRNDSQLIKEQIDEALIEAGEATLRAWTDPDNSDLIIISYPGFALHADGMSIVIPLEVA